MGTNFYLRRVKPREVYDEYHIVETQRATASTRGILDDRR